VDLTRMQEPITFPVSPRTDLRTAFFWIACGAGIVFASWQMDRFERQEATLYTAPGLWPGIIGLLLALLGGILVWRSIARARQSNWDALAPDDTVLVPAARFRLAALMFFVYALLLVGRGLPFWIGTTAFVTTFVYVFRRADRIAAGTPVETRKDATLAIICGIATAVIVSQVFEKLFYVRLP
ncbi:MAG: tripartite tricarboxylate transporter TctB family protein, partial [Betaproteobacteria bacterium]